MTALTPVVLHPRHQDGVKDALEQLTDIELIAPRTEEEIPAALARDGSVLVTYVWRDVFLDSGLRWLQSHSAGYDQYPTDKLVAKGVVLTSASGVHVVCAEHAIGLLCMLVRDMHTSVRDMEKHGSIGWNTVITPEVGGRTVVILGLGAIGEAMAQRLQGWDMRLIGVTRDPSRYGGILTDVRPLSELARACAEATVLMIAVAAGPQTRGIVTAGVLDALGQGWLINVARGAIVDEAAMIERLRDRRLFGAGLDVTQTEPLPKDSPLWDLPNVVITPHRAGLTTRCGERLAALLSHNLRAYRGEGEWKNRIC